jgi:hypothetical protein
MAAEVGENAIDIALEVARALTAVGAEYFLGGSLASSLQAGGFAALVVQRSAAMKLLRQEFV